MAVKSEIEKVEILFLHFYRSRSSSTIKWILDQFEEAYEVLQTENTGGHSILPIPKKYPLLILGL